MLQIATSNTVGHAVEQRHCCNSMESQHTAPVEGVEALFLESVKDIRGKLAAAPPDKKWQVALDIVEKEQVSRGKVNPCSR